MHVKTPVLDDNKYYYRWFLVSYISQAIAFYLTFRLRTRGHADDLFISQSKKSRKSLHLKTG